jgi:hypothetical protein
MKRISVLVSLVAVLVMVPASARAQEAVTVEATIGLQGYVAPYHSTNLTVRVAADVLFVGDMQVSIGGVNLFTAIEVPAGSSKEYVVAIPPTGNNSRATILLFAEGSDDALVRETVAVLNQANEVLVGVVGVPVVEPALAAAGTVPFDRPLTVLNLTPEELGRDLAPLAYLVVGKGSLTGVGPEVLAAASDWVHQGGRIVGSADDLGRLEGSPGPATALTSETTVAPLGNGELVVVDDPASVSDWSRVIRDVPPLSLSTNQFDEGFGFQMVEAASAGGDTATPGIPWLLAALAIYVILVGPVNFMILRRFQRRELAWVTIPAVSAMMLAALWVAGRSQLDDRIVTHASIVVQDDDNIRALSTLIVAAGGEGEHTLDVPAGWSIAPLDFSMMFGQGSRLEARVAAAPDGGTRLSFDLPNLGAASASASWNPDPIALRADVEMDGNNLTATLHNDGDISFWAWGIGDGTSAQAASGPLDPGQSGSTTLRPRADFFEGGGMIADAVMSRGNWDWSGSGPDPWQRVWPLSETMSRQEARVLQSGPYFFGYTDDLVVEVAVDEYRETARGPALVVVPLDVPAFAGNVNGVGEIVRIVGANFVDSYPGFVYASGADAVELRFRVADGTEGEATIKHRGGHLPGVELLEIYNWDTGSFDEYSWPGGFPVGSYVSPTDEVMVRIVLAQAEFNDLDLPTGGITLAVGSS